MQILGQYEQNETFHVKGLMSEKIILHLQSLTSEIQILLN
jgi:hypothetical protein